ncbi:primosomal protein N' family DNA-binding protein [Nesterenkonia haasae]|uniref:primosomal protein N' family DNA-binding protein n=1 Tax=Nesterenkonia haasae TaxID=2587813 RepID=UPI001390995F|nr:primosomal protein N' [Nesterenkonia haasae]NDK30647.1 primosomal protein N' [Nesterenkonia haasae]
MTERDGDQPALLDALAPAPAAKLPAGAAENLPIAQVLLESPVPHLDRIFDYAVPIDLDEQIVPGARVKVRFSSRDMSGYVLDRAHTTTAPRLTLISKVVTALPLLSPEVLTLCRGVAERYAGVTADVLRAAIPQRAARVEKEFAGEEAPAPAPVPTDPGPREATLALKSFGDDGWPNLVVTAAKAAHAVGKGVIVAVPDQRDVDRVMPLLEQELGADTVAQLTAEMGPTPRYRSYLRLRYGQARVVLGTRSAVFAPVQGPAQIIIVDDHDPSHQEPRAPYHHTREVALLRSVQTGAGIRFISTSRSLEVQRLVERGWLAELSPPRTVRTGASPVVTASSDSYQQERDPTLQRARLPGVAYRTARDGLERGPVLVQVGRTGFIPAVLCERCRARQVCPECHGPLALPGHFGQSDSLRCRWCGLHQRGHRCPECGAGRFRAGAIGADRTAQELGRAFPNIPVISSTSDHPVREVADKPSLVISTPGVEPVAREGYAAALILDGDAQLAREGLDVPRQVLSRWFNAASLVRSRSQRGAVVVTADDPELTGALVRWDPAGYARRELYRRLELDLPPAVRMLTITGDSREAEAFVAQVKLPEGVNWVGPAPTEEGTHRWMLFFGYAQAASVVAEVSRARRTGSAYTAGQGRALRIAVDDTAALQF